MSGESAKLRYRTEILQLRSKRMNEPCKPCESSCRWRCGVEIQHSISISCLNISRSTEWSKQSGFSHTWVQTGCDVRGSPLVCTKLAAAFLLADQPGWTPLNFVNRFPQRLMRDKETDGSVLLLQTVGINLQVQHAEIWPFFGYRTDVSQ